MKKAIISIFILAAIVFSLSWMPVGASGSDIDVVEIEEVLIRPEIIIVGDRVEIELILKNPSKDIVNLIGKLLVDDTVADKVDAFIPINGVGNLVFSITFKNPNRYDVSCLISVEGSEASREIWRETLNVTPYIKRGVELNIRGGIYLDPAFPEPGDDVEISVTVENLGDEDASDVSIYFYEDGFPFEREVVDISAGDSVYVMMMWPAEEGDTFLEVKVDPEGQFKDDKMNNRASEWVKVR